MTECSRCGTPMLRTHRQEVEAIGDATLITEVFINECTLCSAKIIIMMPMFPEPIEGLML